MAHTEGSAYRSISRPLGLLHLGLTLVIVVSLVGGQALARIRLGDISMTAIVSTASFILGVLVLLLQFPLSGPRSRDRAQAVAVSLYIGAGSYFVVLFFSRPTWGGAQLLLAVSSSIVLFLVGRSGYFHFEKSRWLWLVGFLLLGIVTVLLAADTFFLGMADFSLRWRDRGEILLLSAAATPLIVRNLRFAWFVVTFFLICVFFTDSRAASLVAFIVFGLITFGVLRDASPGLRVFLSSVAVFSMIFVQWLVATLVELRAVVPVTAIAEVLVQRPETFSNSDSLANAVSNGRTEVWFTILDSLNSWQHWIFGKGLGYSAEIGSTINPSFHHPHNEYLRLLADSGVVGLSLALVAMAVIFAKLVRLHSLGSRNASVGMLVLIVFGTMSFVSNPLTSIHFLPACAYFLGVSSSPTPAVSKSSSPGRP